MSTTRLTRQRWPKMEDCWRQHWLVNVDQKWRIVDDNIDWSMLAKTKWRISEDKIYPSMLTKMADCWRQHWLVNVDWKSTTTLTGQCWPIHFADQPVKKVPIGHCSMAANGCHLRTTLPKDNIDWNTANKTKPAQVSHHYEKKRIRKYIYHICLNEMPDFSRTIGNATADDKCYCRLCREKKFAAPLRI